MGFTLFTSYSFSLKYHQQTCPSHNLVVQSSLKNGIPRTKVAADSRGNGLVDGEAEKLSGFLKRRSVLASGISLFCSAVLGFPSESLAVVKQGLLAGRIPGLSEPSEEGLLPFSYTSFEFCFFFSLLHSDINKPRFWILTSEIEKWREIVLCHKHLSFHPCLIIPSIILSSTTRK